MLRHLICSAVLVVSSIASAGVPDPGQARLQTETLVMQARDLYQLSLSAPPSNGVDAGREAYQLLGTALAFKDVLAVELGQSIQKVDRALHYTDEEAFDVSVKLSQRPDTQQLLRQVNDITLTLSRIRVALGI